MRIVNILQLIAGVAWDSLQTILLDVLCSRLFDIDTSKRRIKLLTDCRRIAKRCVQQVAVADRLERVSRC